MTTVGKKCLFPFKYSNDTHPELTYKICSSLDVYRPWCPTLLNENLEVLEWGDCLDDCPTEAVQKVCIDEPNFPIMADGSDRAVNYTANYTLGSGLVTDEVKSISLIFDKCSMLLETIWPWNHGLWTANEGINQRNFGLMRQAKYTLAVPRKLRLGVDFQPCSESDFLTGRL